MKQQFIRVFSLFLAILMLLGTGSVPAQAADTISLPSPSAYFGSNPKTEMDGKVTVYIYSFASYPEAKVDQYVKDMQAKGLTLTNQGNWSDGDALRRMEWKKDAAVVLWWREKTKTVEVRVHPCVTLTSGTAGSSTGSTQIPLPMPKDYFKNAKENFYEEEYHVYRYTYKYSNFPSEEVEKYKTALNQLGFDTHYQQKYSSGNVLCSVKMNDTQCLSFYFNKEEKQLLVNLFDKELEKAGYISSGSSYAPVKTVTTGGTATDPKPVTGPSVLDLIEDCFGSYKSKTYDEENYKTVFLFKGSTTFPKANFEKLKKYTESKGMKYYLHDFRNKKRMSVYHDVGGSLISGKWDKNTGEITIEIRWEYIKKSGFFDASEIPEDSREPDPVVPPDGTEICGACSGRKSCWDCGGAGETKERIIGLIGQYSTKTCSTCHGLKKCPTCGGHGWVNK